MYLIRLIMKKEKIGAILSKLNTWSLLYRQEIVLFSAGFIVGFVLGLWLY